MCLKTHTILLQYTFYQLQCFHKGLFKKYVRWGEAGGGHWKANKNEQGDGVCVCVGGGGLLAFVYVRFFKKNAEIFEIKFCSYSPVFPIDYNSSMKY